MNRAQRPPVFERPWLVAALVFAWLALIAWYRPLTSPDEGRYATVAYEMIRSGDWLVPRLNGLPFFHKPPLFYWIGAAAMSVLGATEWAARLPSLLGATLAAVSLLFFLRRWTDAKTAMLSAAVLASMPFFYIGAQFANLDMLVAGLISATVLLAAHAALSRREAPDSGWRRALAGAFVCAGLGVLAKGLIGLVLPGMVFVLWCVATRRLRDAWLMAWPPGLCLLVAVAGPWLVAMQLRYPEFFDYFIVTQHFRRFAASGFNNEHPFWFYLPVIAALSLPWVGWLLRKPRAARKDPHTSDVNWLMGIWGLGIVVFFSIPRSKLIGYVLPALPPLAYLIATRVRAAVDDTGRMAPAVRWSGALAGAVCVAGVIAGQVYAKPPSAGLDLPPGQAVAPTDQVVMLDAYYYEVPFYWKLQQQVTVWSNWTPEVVNAQDSWRKELHDAGHFEPALATRLLVGPGASRGMPCMTGTTWLIGPPNLPSLLPWLAQAELVTDNSEMAVWRLTRQPEGLACTDAPGAPSPRTAVAP